MLTPASPWSPMEALAPKANMVIPSDDDRTNRFRMDYEIPSSVEIRHHSPDDPINNDGSWIEIPKYAISECGIRFPLPRLLRELLNVLDLHPCQLSPISYEIVAGILKLNEMEDIDIGVWEILYCYAVRPETESRGTFSLQGRRKRSIIHCLTSRYFSERIFVRGDWEFPMEEVEPIRCRRTFGTLAEIPHWTELQNKINLDGLRSKVFNRKFRCLAAGVYWRSSPILLGYRPCKYKNPLISLPAGVLLARARKYFDSKEFWSLLKNQDGPGSALKDADEDHNPAIIEEGISLDDDIHSLRTEGHETRIASEFDYSVDDIPSLGLEGQVFPSILVSEPDLVPQRPYGLFKRKSSAHLSAETLCKKGKKLRKDHGSSHIRAADKETINSMSPDIVVNYSKVLAEKIGEGYISATKEVTRLNTLLQNLERRASTAENRLLALESFSQGYQNEICELQEKIKLLEARNKEEIKQARAQAIEQCHVKYSKEMTLIANQHYGHGWGGALMAARVDGSASLWNSDSIPSPYKVEFP